MKKLKVSGFYSYCIFITETCLCCLFDIYIVAFIVYIY